jgi:hypothetical protein
MKVYNKVSTKSKDSYFEVLINGKVKFIHKQTACWVLTKEENKISADRLRGTPPSETIIPLEWSVWAEIFRNE